MQELKIQSTLISTRWCNVVLQVGEKFHDKDKCKDYTVLCFLGHPEHSINSLIAVDENGICYIMACKELALMEPVI